MSCVVVLMPQPEAVKEVKTRLTRGKLIIPEIMRPEKKKKDLIGLKATEKPSNV